MSEPAALIEPDAEPALTSERRPPERSLRSVAASGALWTAAGYGSGQLLRFGGNLILTRLLFEEAFGLMLLVNVLLQGLQLLSDIGIGPSVIQSEHGDERRFLDTAFSMQAVRGVALAAIACALALPAARFYEQPELALLIPVASVSTLLGGLGSTKLFTMQRRLSFAAPTLLELGSQAAGLVTMIAWAWFSPSVWALVAGAVVVYLVKAVGSHVALAGPNNRFAWDASAARAVFHFGKWIFLSTVLTFLAGYSDRLVFGKLIPLGMLGVYGIGMMIAQLPQMALGQAALSLLFPIYSRVHNAGGDLASVFRRVRLATLAAGGWMLSGLVAGGSAAVELLYDERYVDAGWIVQVLAIGAWFYTLETSNGAGLLALGRPKWVAAANGGKLVGMLVLIPLGFAQAGFPGAVCGLALAEVLKYVVSAFGTSRAGLPGRLQDLGTTALLIGAAHLGWIAERAVAAGGGSPLLRSLTVAGVSTLVFLPLGLWLWRAFRATDARGAGA